MAKDQRFCHLCGVSIVLADFDSHLPKCGRLWLMDHDLPVDATNKLPVDPGLEEREGGITQDYLDTLADAEERAAGECQPKIKIQTDATSDRPASVPSEPSLPLCTRSRTDVVVF